jgi:4-hydroxyphenylacetate 3-hydroxylase N terminal
MKSPIPRAILSRRFSGQKLLPKPQGNRRNRQPEDVLGSGPGATRPFTGAEYLENLKDGREIYIYGERVNDVTTHPAFRNAARIHALLNVKGSGALTL